MGRPKGSKNKPKEIKEEIKEDIKEEEGELGEPHHQKRAAAIEEIAAQNRENREEPELVVDGDEIVAAPEEEIEVEEKTETSEIETEEKEEIPEEPEKRKFIVDGVEKEYTDVEITAMVQKHGTADARLEEATNLLKDAQATQTVTPPTPEPPVSTSSEADVKESDTLAKDLTNAIVYGDEEQVAKAVEELLGKGREDTATQTQGMSPEQVQGYVDETIAFNEGKRLLDTPPDKGGYSDLWSDPVLKGEFQRRENVLRDANDPRSYVELYSHIGDEVRAWRDNLIKEHTPKTGLEDRDTAKRETGVVRGAGAKPTAPMESKPETHEEKLAKMQAARGQT